MVSIADLRNCKYCNELIYPDGIRLHKGGSPYKTWRHVGGNLECQTKAEPK